MYIQGSPSMLPVLQMYILELNRQVAADLLLGNLDTAAA